MYGNPYYGNPQVSMDRIDNQIKELEGMRAQLQQRQQPAINQTFQLAPNSGGVRFVSSVEDVSKELVFTDTVFLSRDFKSMWIKNTKGEIRPFEIKEVVKKDEKDLIIDELKARLERLERGDKDARTELSDNASEPVQE